MSGQVLDLFVLSIPQTDVWLIVGKFDEFSEHSYPEALCLFSLLRVFLRFKIGKSVEWTTMILKAKFGTLDLKGGNSSRVCTYY